MPMPPACQSRVLDAVVVEGVGRRGSAIMRRVGEPMLEMASRVYRSRLLRKVDIDGDGRRGLAAVLH